MSRIDVPARRLLGVMGVLTLLLSVALIGAWLAGGAAGGQGKARF
jgi:hypothetical protein